MRHPGLQHKMRLEEIAEQIAYASSGVQGGFNQYRDLEKKAAEIKKEIATSQKKLDSLLALQAKLIEAQTLSQFGLPADISKESFEVITEHQITS